LFGLGNGRLHESLADLEAAPVAEYRNPADMPIAEQACGAYRVVILKRQEMDGLAVLAVPFQFGGHTLFVDEDRLADASQCGIILVPVGQAYVNFTHRQTPGCLA